MDDIAVSKNCVIAEKTDDNLSENFDSDSGSSVDLPVLSSSAFDIQKLQKNDIVWAEYKHLYWPAIVRNIDKKSRKISISYCDTLGKSFKVPFQKIHSFNDMEFKKEVENQEMSDEMKQLHTKVVSLAFSFCHQRAIGECDDPALYFETSKPYFELPNHGVTSMDKTGQDSQQESKNKENDCFSAEREQSASEMSPKKENEAGSSEKNRVSTISKEFVDSFLDSIESSDGESLLESDTEDYKLAICYAHMNDASGECDEKTADAIVSCIKSGCVDQYLLDIHCGKIKSRNHDIFKKAKKVRRKDLLWHCSQTVDIGDFERRRDIANYLKELYDRTVKKKGFMWGEIDYVATVWLYEAVDKAFSLIKSEPSKFHIASDAVNCPGPSDKEHPSLAENYDDQNGKKTKIESSVSNSDKAEDKKIRGKNSQRRTKTKETTQTKRKLNLRNKLCKRNCVATSNSLKSRKSLDEITSDVDSKDLAKYQRKCRPRKKIN